MTSLEKGRGYYNDGSNVMTFEVQGFTEREDILNQERRAFYSSYLADNCTLRVGDYVVPVWGEGHNLYPQDVYDTISANKLLPELIEKQVRFLYGKGPFIYRMESVNDRMRRVPVGNDYPEITSWLSTWEQRGMECSAHEYLIRCIRDFYHVETVVSKFRFNRSRRLGTPTLPVAGLEFVGTEDARKASSDILLQSGFQKVRDRDCRFVVVGDWLNPTKQDMDVYPRFEPANPFAHEVAVSWVKNRSFTKDVYAYNLWFRGLRDWILGANLNPKYINSYFKNALNARIHVIIPHAWYDWKKNILSGLCEKNAEYRRSELPLQAEYSGVKLLNENGEPYEFNEAEMMTALVNDEMRRITDYLSGEGKNQGKIFTSFKWDTGGKEEQKWEFAEIPSKFKEFIDSIISYDRRTDEVILAGKGVDSALSNVSEDGIISRSGGDVYYNYLIYINALDIPEYYVTLDLNRAVALNFPEAYASGVRIGLYHEVPAKQAETTPNERLSNNAGQ